jgi:hypothetical protein
MKMKVYFLPILAVVAVFLMTGFGGSTTTNNSDYGSGSPAGYTGSPGDGKNCSNVSGGCHNSGAATTVPGLITSNIPGTGYVAGSSYTITATVTGTQNKGFEVSPQNASGTLLGTLTAGSGSKLVGGGKYVTQNNAVGGSSATWNFTWTAPAAGTGTVTFYGAFALARTYTRLSTLVVNEAATPLAATATATPGSICSGQNSQLNVIASGGSGTYTYSWTSIPPGYTSGIQNPVVSPTASTQYVAHVSDGTNTTTDTTEVLVTSPPTASAGTDTTYCVDVPEIPLNGTATGASSVLWTTSGDGTFSSATSLTGFYYPGTNDKSTLSVHLTLTASPVSPCASPAASTRNILFDPCGVGVQNMNDNLFSFSLRPNPSNGTFCIHSSGMKKGEVTIRIMNLNGKVFLTESVAANGGSFSHDMDLTGFVKGVYFVRIETGEGVKTGKMILQ